MSSWVEYCNLEDQGRYAKMRIANGHKEPYKVKYRSIGNENYGRHEIGAKTAREWGHFVAESAKMMRRVDPEIELSAAALPDIDWNVELLTAMGLEQSVKIAFDEWNLKEWYHPNIHGIEQGLSESDFLDPGDDNDNNALYTMSDAVFTACFLNTLLRNCDIVAMANYAPAVNTRGLIYSYKDGIVLRSTYYVFYLYANYMGDLVKECRAFHTAEANGAVCHDGKQSSDPVDFCFTTFSDKDIIQ